MVRRFPLIVSMTWALSFGVSAEPVTDPLTDEMILTQVMATREFCKKSDAGRAGDYDKAFVSITKESQAELKALEAKPDFATTIANRVAEFELREKEPDQAGAGKNMCANFLMIE
jgi:hypothetical protein